MVDALRSAGSVLRPRGRVVDVRPVSAYKPTIVIRRGRQRVGVGPIVRHADPDVTAAARAVRSVVRAGDFAVVYAVSPMWKASYADLADVERMVAQSENWALPAATRRRIKREWREGDVIELTRPFSLTVLRRASSNRLGDGSRGG
jgi:hypothetical protein